MAAAPEHWATPLTLAAIRQLWTFKRDREQLLGLGERKQWSDATERDAVRTFVGFLDANRMLPKPAPIAATGVITPQQGNLAWLTGPHRVWASAASLVGTQPEVFGNSRVRGWKPHRSDHKWVLAFGRDIPASELAYDRRSVSGDERLWGRLATHVGHGTPDAADAVFLFSLLRLHQQRRGEPASRREVAKPIVRSERWFLEPGAVERLTYAFLRAPPERARPAANLVVEAELARASLAPHRDRRTTAPLDSGVRLQRAGALIKQLRPLLGPRALVLEARAAMMLRYSQQQPSIAQAPGAYFELSTLLGVLFSERRTLRLDERNRVLTLLESDEPGTLMLRPRLLRRLSVG